MVDKKAINYYKSFYDVSKDLNQKQFYDFNMAIYKVMFFEEHIDEIVFTDKVLNLLWKSVKHSVRASVDGYCTKKGTPYNTLFDPLTKPLNKPLANNEQVQEQEQEQEQVQGQGQVEFTFKLKQTTQYENLSSEYISELHSYAKNLNLLEAMIDYHSSNGKGFKDWSAAFRTWERNDKKFSASKPANNRTTQSTTNSTIDKYFAQQNRGEIIDARID